MRVEKQYSLRDHGPAGGLVFYDKGSYSGESEGADEWRYLEAAPCVYHYGGTQWCKGWDTRILAYPGEAIGTGRHNTSVIVQLHKNVSAGQCAAMECSTLTISGYSGWFLPSIDELETMHRNLAAYGRGDFTTHPYWSSSEVDDYGAWCWTFTGNGRKNYCSKRNANWVRAVRAF